MPLPNHISPDHFLDLENVTAVSREQGVAAWDRAYEQLAARLSGDGRGGTVYVLLGLQGGGKSTWIRDNAPLYPASATFFEGPLPSIKCRLRALSICKAAGCSAVAVWINTPFAIALQRNARRKGLARTKDEALTHVRDRLEAPSMEEGFAQVIDLRPKEL